jgi:shikimate 5-dehydrogenase
VANSTSVGMHPDADSTPVDASVFRPGMVAFDAVYSPRETRMLREARARGAEIADGVEMFVGQAMRQFEIWTGTPAPREIMETIVIERLSHP